MRKIIWLVMLLVNNSSVVAMSVDEKLRIAIEINKLEAKNCDENQYKSISDKEFKLGRKLFETKILSGNKDIACRACHLDEFNTTDGLPLAVGVSGEGEGEERYAHGKGILVQRNAFSLKGRGNKQFINYFCRI